MGPRPDRVAGVQQAQGGVVGPCQGCVAGEQQLEAQGGVVGPCLD